MFIFLLALQVLVSQQTDTTTMSKLATHTLTFDSTVTFSGQITFLVTTEDDSSHTATLYLTTENADTIVPKIRPFDEHNEPELYVFSRAKMHTVTWLTLFAGFFSGIFFFIALYNVLPKYQSILASVSNVYIFVVVALLFTVLAFLTMEQLI